MASASSAAFGFLRKLVSQNKQRTVQDGHVYYSRVRNGTEILEKLGLQEWAQFTVLGGTRLGRK